ncbi:MAG: electron transport complex subunit RsxC [Clostridia bacterium]|nr:electron transport complex subunit RsxC [Clostridia bacterium]
MMFHTFKGGLHIPDYKELTAGKPIIALDGDKVHIYPLQQHIGAPLEPKVAKGDEVRVGQVIADSDAFVSTPVHSSVSGRVVDIKPYLHPSGAKVTAVFVENDFTYTKHESIKPYDAQNMSKEEMLSVVRNAGIVGMGGAGFPTHVKLSPPPDKTIDYLIINCAECEPYITADHRRMIEDTDTIIDGICIVMKILGLSKAYVGIEMNKPDAYKIMKEKALEAGNINIIPLKTKYPQGAEKQLIYAVTKRQVPSGGLPADVGAIVMNVDTVSQISKTFRTGMPLIKRVVTVSGDAIANPSNFEVYTGVTFQYLIDAAGGFSADVQKLVMGGPMMGIAQYSTEPPVVKTTSSILALSSEGGSYDDYSPCIRCGKCVDHCPMGLMPLYLSKFAVSNDLEKAEEYNILDCIECGLCSYLCPGKQSPLHNIRIAKQKILESRRKNK